MSHQSVRIQAVFFSLIMVLSQVALFATFSGAAAATAAMYGGNDLTTESDGDFDWVTTGGNFNRTGENPDSAGPGMDAVEHWSASLDGDGQASPVVVDGTVYMVESAGSADNSLYAFDAETGDEIWVNNEADEEITSGLTVHDGTIYFGDDDGFVNAHDATTGDQEWSKQVGDSGDRIATTPAVGSGYLFVGNGLESEIYGINLSDRDDVWTETTGGWVQGSLTYHDGEVYRGDGGGHVVIHDAKTGAKLETNEGDREPLRAPLTLFEGTLYGVDNTDTIYAWDANDLSEKTSQTLDAGVVRTGGMAVADGTVYVGTTAGTVYALNADDLTEEWVAELDYGIATQPSYDNGILYIGDGEDGESDGSLYALNTANEGEELWKFDTPSDAVRSAPAIYDGRIFFGSDDQMLYALENPYSGGDGSADNPYEIADWHDLNNVRDNLGSQFVVVEDLDEEAEGYNAVASGSANGDAGFEPIGETGDFSGTLDGDGHTISNLVINRNEQEEVGLFSSPDGATIENLTLDAVAVTGDHRVGGLAGRIDDTQVTNVHVNGTVAADSDAGGLVGSTGNSPTIQESSASADVNGNSNSIGGLIGWSNDAIVENTYATGDVDGTDASNVGGLIGHVGAGEVSTSYAAGSVDGGDDRGGLFGQVNEDGWVSDSYWDEAETGEGSPIGAGNSGTGLISLSTDELQGEAAEDNMSRFDWGSTWAWVTVPEDDYPVFQWQTESDDLVYSDLSVTPTDVDTGDEIAATATLANEGEEKLSYNAPLRVEGSVVDRAQGTVDAGDSTGLELTHAMENAGEINVTIGDLDPKTVSVLGFPIFEDFEGDRDDNWVIDGDAEWGVTHEGAPTLHLTDTRADESGLGFYDQPFSSDDGIIVEFEYYADGGDGADGTAFFLVDGDHIDENTIQAGASGGPLGYGYRDNEQDGIPHAYLGVGFDEFGNFVDQGGDDNLGTDVPDSVGIRGAGNEQSGYNYLTHADVNDEFGESIDGGLRLARVTVVPDAAAGETNLRVEMSWDDGQTWETVIDDFTYEETPPENLKLGFTGSTGTSDNIHAINTTSVQLPADLAVEVTDEPGTLSSGEAFEYEYEVVNLGPNDATVTVENTLPIGPEKATDVSWSYETDTDSDSGTDLDNVGFSLDEDETATVTVAGTIDEDASDDLDHTLEATGDSTLDPDVETATAAVQHTVIDESEAPVCGDVEYTAEDGTSLIENLHQLQCIGDDADGPGLDQGYQLVDDINATGTDDWNGGDGFDPIGDAGSEFTGHFDGDGHTISDLYIHRGDEDDVGLFGVTATSSTIENIVLTDPDVTGKTGVGALVGASSGTVSETGIDGGTVSSDDSSGDDTHLGGMVGVIYDGTVERSWTDTTVEGTDLVEVGGLAGDMDSSGVVVDSYSTSTVAITNGEIIGGLLGDANENSDITNSYAAGSVTGDSKVGGLLGREDGGPVDVTGSYWDEEATGQEESAGDGESLFTADMTGLHATVYMDELDWDDTWATVTFPEDDYPVLEWQLIDKNLELTDFEVEPTILDRGDEITATARLTNEGDAEAIYNVPFEVDGNEIERAEGKLASGSFVELEFTHTVETTGEVDVVIGEHEPETVTVAEELLDITASNPTDGFDVDIELTATGELDNFIVDLEDQNGMIVQSFYPADFTENENDEYVYDGASYEVSSSGSYTATVISASDANGQALTLDDDSDTVYVTDGTEFFECGTPTELVDHLVQDDNIEVMAVDSTGNCQQAAASFANLDFGSGNDVDFELPDGIHLSTFSGMVPQENTQGSWGGPNNGERTSGTERFYQDIEIAAEVSNPQNAMGIEFEFVVPDGVDAVEFQFMFGSEEYPTWVDSVVDGAAVMVDGVNYAMFEDGTPLKVVSEADLHPNTGAQQWVDPHHSTEHDEIELDIEYNGISEPMRISAPLDTERATHTARITVADTMDQILASGLFISAMAETDDTSGGIGELDPPDAPSIATSDGPIEFLKDDATDDPVTVDDDLSLEHDHDIEEAEVRIAGGFEAGDELAVEGDQGLTVDYDTDDGILTLEGTAAVSDYEDALQSVTFTTVGDLGEQDRDVQFRITDYGTDGGVPTIIPGASRTVDVTLNPPPTAIAIASQTEAEVADDIAFDGSQSSDPLGIDSYTWEFGDGQSDTGETVTHSYGTDGEYEVVLTVEDEVGQMATDTLNITVEGGEFLIVDAGGNQTADEGEQVYFDATDSEATTDIQQYDWEFGDGTQQEDTTALPTHTYDEPGEYQVNLTMHAAGGITASTSTYVTVEDATPPDADASADETTPDLGDAVEFDAGGTTDNVDETAALTFEWDLWGDGSIDAIGETVEHTYDMPVSNTITATLYATDTSGNTGIDTVDIDIQNTEEPTVDAGDDVAGSTGEAIEFDGSGSRDNTGIDTYEWDFGDGTTATGKTVIHKFEQPGDYEVELTVTNDVGLQNTTTTWANITAQPTVETGEDGTLFEQFNGSVQVAPTLELNSEETITGATVHITDGFDSTTDQLAVQDGVAATYDIHTEYDADRGVLSLSGEASETAYQAVLRNVTYQNTATHPDEGAREIQFTLGEETLYNDETGHFYSYVEDEGIFWQDAQEDASDRTLFGLGGELVTITSAKENTFLENQFETGGWIGASDANEESVWRWVTGPEGEEDDGQGLHFFEQTASHTGSHIDAPVYPTPPDGVPGGGDPLVDEDGETYYENWDLHEPNNKFPQFGGQDYGYFCMGTPSCADGTWMDLDGDHNGEPTPAGYFVQYGSMPGEPDDLQLSDSQTVTVEPRDEPVADAGEDMELTDPEDATVEFTANGSSADFDIVSYDWELDHDGATDTGQVVEHSFTDDGEYTVELTIEDAAGLTDTDSIGVTVDEGAIIIAESGGNITVDDGDLAQFDGTGSDAVGGIDSYDWDFGDGNTSTDATPTHVYDEPGTYDVELKVTDADNDNDATTSSYVIVRDITPPDTVLEVNETVPGIGETVKYDATNTTDNVDSQEDLTFEWDLNNNGQFTETGVTINRSYHAIGEVTTAVRVTDTSGNTNETNITVSVENQEPPNVDAGTDRTGFAGEQLVFDGVNSTAANNAAIAEFEWDLTDDGETDDTGVSTTHTFDSAGDHDVTLTVTDEFGNEATDTITVGVIGPPEIETSDHEPLFEEHVGPTPIDPALGVEYDDDFEGAVVSIDGGFDSGTDVLDLNASEAAMHGISHEYDADRGVLELSGVADGAAYESVLRTATYEHTGQDPAAIEREISFTLGDGQLPLEANGHFYEFIEEPQITWHDARDAANDRTHFGQQGYLATITSEEINQFVVSKLQGEGWIGASDEAEESVWRWVTGPEGLEDDDRGLHFFNQTASDDGAPMPVYGGSTSGGGYALEDEHGEEFYENWDTNEPNEWGSGEDHAHYWATGTWNDYVSDNPSIDGYIVEYGGMPSDPDDLQLTDSIEVSVESRDKPVADAGEDMDVTDIDTAEIDFDAGSSTLDPNFEWVSFAWNFGDGHVALPSLDNETYTHAYTQDGSYTVELTVEDSANLTATDEIAVTVDDDAILVADAGTNQSVDEGEEVTFDASGSDAVTGDDSIEEYQWDFGDGFTSSGETLEAPNHTYDLPGLYEVGLTVVDEHGNTATTRTYVDVADVTDPEAEASVSESPVAIGDTVTYDAADSTDNVDIESYEWDLTSNGQFTETGVTTTQTFDEISAETTVMTTLRVTDTSGNTDETTVTVSVENLNDPVANVGDGFTAFEGEKLQFDGTDSQDDVGIEEFEWEFGDGAEGAGPTSTHSFDEPGTYVVNLTVTDTGGNSDEDSMLVTVQERSVISFDASLADDEIDVDEETQATVSGEFSTTNPERSLGNPIEIDDVAFESADEDVVTVEDDGIVSAEGPGMTMVNATVGDEIVQLPIGVDLAVVSPTITAFEATNPADIDVEITFESDQPLSAIDVVISGAESTSLAETAFTETEGDSTYVYETTYEGTEGGKYDIELVTALDDDGNDGADTVEISDSVETLAVHASASSFLASVGTDITLRTGEDTLVPDEHGDVEYRWDVGADGTPDEAGETATHVFETPGEIEVELQIETDIASATDSITVDIEDRTPPITKLEPVETVENDTVATFDATGTTDNVDVVEYAWDFGDGTTVSGGDLDEPVHTYTKPGVYTVEVTASDAAGNEGTNETTLVVEGPFANVAVDERDFGETPLEAENMRSVPVTNDGTTPLEIEPATAITGDDEDQFDLRGDVGEETVEVPPGQTVSVVIVYSPDEEEAHDATLELETNHVDSEIDLTGAGVQSDLRPDPSTITFGDVAIDTSEAGTTTIENGDSVSVGLSTVEIVGIDADQFSLEDPIPDEVDGDGEADFDLVFEPTKPGELSATLRIEDAAGTTAATVPLNGTGIGPAVTVPEETIEYGEVGRDVSTARTFTVANTGNEPLDVTDVSIEGVDADAFVVENEPDTVPADDTAEIQIGFTPDDDRNYDGTVVIQSNDPVAGAVQVSLNGTGVGADIDASPRSINFDETEVGEIAYAEISVDNLVTSLTDLDVNATSIVNDENDEFDIVDGGADFTLEPGQTRVINISFEPVTVDERNAQLQILSDAGNEPQITVWLSSSDTYIIVQEVAVDDDSSDDAIVNLDARNVDTGSDLAVNVSQPGTRAMDVTFETFQMTTDHNEAFEINTTHSADPVGGDAQTYTSNSDEVLVQYVRMNHSVDAEATFDNTTIDFRVRKDAVPTDDPDDVRLHRYDEGGSNDWVEMPLDYLGETSSKYLYSSATPGFSEFVVTAAKEMDDDDGTVGETDPSEPTGPISSPDTGEDEVSDEADTEEETEDEETDGTDDTSGDETEEDETEEDETEEDETDEDETGVDDERDLDTTVPEGEDPPTGDISDDDGWEQLAELPELELDSTNVDLDDGQLTSTVTVTSTVDYEITGTIRHIHNGEVVAENDIIVPAQETVDLSHTENLTESGEYGIDANIAIITPEDEQIRTFDFPVGDAEFEEDSDVGETPGDDDGLLSWYLIVAFVGAILLLLLIVVWRRRDDEEEEEGAEMD